MKELSHEQLGAMLECFRPTWIPAPLRDGLLEAGLLEFAGNRQTIITPRGRALVDVALAAVNAELGKEAEGT